MGREQNMETVIFYFFLLSHSRSSKKIKNGSNQQLYNRVILNVSTPILSSSCVGLSQESYLVVCFIQHCSVCRSSKRLTIQLSIFVYNFNVQKIIMVTSERFFLLLLFLACFQYLHDIDSTLETRAGRRWLKWERASFNLHLCKVTDAGKAYYYRNKSQS